MSHIESYMDDLVGGIRDHLRNEYGKNTCVLSTRVAVECLRKAGIPVQEVVSECIVMNQEYHDKVLGKEAQLSESDVKGTSAFCVAVVQDQPGSRGLCGHMVAIVNQEYLLDMSIDQFTRPEKNIFVKAFWSRIPAMGRKAIIKGREPILLSSDNEDGTKTWILYRLQPERKEYLTSGDWNAPIVVR